MQQPNDDRAALLQHIADLEAENERLRRLLNDPDKLLQRGLRILASMHSPILNAAVFMLRFTHELAQLTAPISPWW